MICIIMGPVEAAAPPIHRHVRVSPGQVRLVRESDVPARRPGPNEALVDVLACGICGTDLHLRHGMRLPAGAEYPVRPGHEVAGTVREVGETVTDVAVGDLVVLHPVDPCRTCDTCLSGAEQLCPNGSVLGIHRPGGLADTVAWPADRMVMANGLAPTRAAVLADAVATAYRAVRTAALPRAGRACVLGAGGVGTHVLELLRSTDPDARLVGVVGRPASATRLQEAGFDVEVSDVGVHRRLKERYGGFDAVVDFSGQADAPRLAVRLLVPGGVLVLGSVLDGDLALGPAVAVQTRELTVRGAYASSLEDLRSVVAMAQDGRLDLTGSVSHVRRLDDAVAAFNELAARPDGLVRMVLTTRDDVA
jgi:2-desacetyl-2-hydroxyethyl bacteriochlorophyllide A dehydrogenase